MHSTRSIDRHNPGGKQQEFNERADIALIAFLAGASVGALTILVLSIIWDTRLVA